MAKVRPFKARVGDRRMRSLASDERAGSAARRRAAELQLETLRRHRRIIPILSALYVVVASMIWFFAGWIREFALGAWTASIVAMGHHVVWQLSGAANHELGALGEQWTAQALRELRPSGWRLINDIHFENWNIDHLLVGPGGIVVVETKTTSKSWTGREQQPWIVKGAEQAGRYSRSMRNYLRRYAGDAPVAGVVVLWPDRDEFPTREIDGVTVVGGRSLAAFIGSLPAGQLDEGGIDTVYDELGRYVAERDTRRLEDDGPAPRSFDDWNYEFLQLVTGLFTGALLSLLVLQLEPIPLAVAVIGLLITGTMGARRRFQRVATLITSAGAACLGVALWVLVDAVFGGG